jgi:radical SAM enzyme (TIGR01210 family)
VLKKNDKAVWKKMNKLGRSKPASSWSEKELLNGNVVDSLVVILKTKGCTWHKKSGCLMCGYHLDSDPSIGDDRILSQFQSVLGKTDGKDVMKVYTSGSFFNEEEVSKDLRRRLLESIEGQTQKLVVESRPEFISEDVINEALGHVKNLEVAIGLESASNLVLKRCVNKGFTFEDYEKAAVIARDGGATIRTYLLIKPPLLTEKEAIEDAIDSARIASEYSDVISFNPLNVQKSTFVDKLWKRGAYRPPWLWSVIHVLDEVKELDSRFVCGPSGGGTPRGAHNCGDCDSLILDALDEFSIGKRNAFDDIECSCRELWLDTMEIEGLIQTSGDAQRIYS